MPRAFRALAWLLALAACQGAPPAPPPETSVKPGVNESYLDPALDVAEFEQRFEVESREIYAQRARIAELLQLRPGLDVADVGAGTGLFTRLIAPAVGPSGKVYAVDIVPKFLEHIRRLAAELQQANVVTVLCTERSIELPAGSVDLVFACDTYHHFEFPRTTLASIHAALRRGGELVVVDFIREEGSSRPWVLEHVRAGQPLVQAEIEAAGFRLVRVEAAPFLRENYVLRFRKP